MCVKNYEYPLALDWSTEEMIAVTNFWIALEQANEGGIAVEELLLAYAAFKQVVRSIGEEKRLGKAFEKVSGYSLYQTIQQAKALKTGKIKMR